MVPTMPARTRDIMKTEFHPSNIPWLWEFSLWATSSAAFGAQLAVLYAYAASPLPDLPYGITLNALISTLSAFSTSTLIAVASSIVGQQKWVHLSRAEVSLSDITLYDEASRGPLGSLILLVKAREWGITSIATVVIVLSLAITPFVQQSTSTRFVPYQETSASYSIRLVYDNSAPGYSSLSNNLIARFYQGLYFLGSLEDEVASNSLQPTPQSCSGNCTYEDFQSLAVCSECADISSYINLDLTVNLTHQNKLWSLPNGFSVSIWESRDDAKPDHSPDELRLQLVTTAEYSPIELTAGYPIINFTAFHPSEDAGSATAHECMLYWCLNRYKATTVLGILKEEILATSKLGRRVQVPDSDEYPDYYYEFNPIGNDPHVQSLPITESTNISFLVGSGAAAFVTNFTSRILTGNVYGEYRTVPMSTSEAVAHLYTTTGHDYNGMESVFTAIATSMTSGLRSLIWEPEAQDKAKTGVTIGTQSVLVPVVQVSWAWIALPATIHLLMLYVLCSSLMYSTRHKMPLWKSSALATVFFGARIRESLDKDIPDDLSKISSVAKEIRVSDCLTQFKRKRNNVTEASDAVDSMTERDLSNATTTTAKPGRVSGLIISSAPDAL
ncbi:hypothetical protein FHL15_002210 [Xylaria flabelliformis]|uniref:Uncharacterized protein n=1 Tax=Xylaria flabelliformis TaxID=2512241 RepID=A0A553I9M6_9PEZI|nr:hypothetical protein FHL15_002210 [Xylaria flabelliformis]